MPNPMGFDAAFFFGGMIPDEITPEEDTKEETPPASSAPEPADLFDAIEPMTEEPEVPTPAPRETELPSYAVNFSAFEVAETEDHTQAELALDAWDDLMPDVSLYDADTFEAEMRTESDYCTLNESGANPGAPRPDWQQKCDALCPSTMQEMQSMILDWIDENRQVFLYPKLSTHGGMVNLV
ncbi:MAG: hypothetical protein LUC50_02350 [Ruminococcus sp.]|nr:hypothetical protein [Ruminococcus sp.]